jgi:hypothetical protein
MKVNNKCRSGCLTTALSCIIPKNQSLICHFRHRMGKVRPKDLTEASAHIV